MKFLLIAIIGILLWNSNDARQFTSDQLQNASEFIDPNQSRQIKLSYWIMDTTQEQKFQEWLQSCPVEYHLLDSDYDQQSYQFIVQSDESW